MNPVRQVTDPPSPPVTRTQAKDHLRVTVDDEDSLIQLYLDAAIGRVEDYRQSNVMSAQFELHVRSWPSSWMINLQKSPVSAINSVKYYDSDNELQTVDAENYRLLDACVPAQLEFDASFVPPDLYEREYPIVVNYQAGYLAASSVSAKIKSAILLELGTLHEIRQSETQGNGLTAIQMKNASMAMIDSETMWL